MCEVQATLTNPKELQKVPPIKLHFLTPRVVYQMCRVEWTDIVFISGMRVNFYSVNFVIVEIWLYQLFAVSKSIVCCLTQSCVWLVPLAHTMCVRACTGSIRPRISNQLQYAGHSLWLGNLTTTSFACRYVICVYIFCLFCPFWPIRTFTCYKNSYQLCAK